MMAIIGASAYSWIHLDICWDFLLHRVWPVATGLTDSCSFATLACCTDLVETNEDPLVLREHEDMPMRRPSKYLER